MKPKDEYQDLYYQASRERWLHRCKLCWRSTQLSHLYQLIGSIVPEDKVVCDNGFVPTDFEYIHEDFCPAKGKF